MGDTAPLTEKPDWRHVVERKRTKREALVQPYLDDSKQQQDITSISDVSKLASLVAKGELKAYDVIMAYVRR